jgi:snRNA-activating protein complex subunit 3
LIALGNQELIKTEPFTEIPKDELVIRASFYDKSRLKQSQYYVLGSQKLTELRDKIYCLSDYVLNPEESTGSGYFFIENVFYNDMRNPRAIDYSS